MSSAETSEIVSWSAHEDSENISARPARPRQNPMRCPALALDGPARLAATRRAPALPLWRASSDMDSQAAMKKTFMGPGTASPCSNRSAIKRRANACTATVDCLRVRPHAVTPCHCSRSREGAFSTVARLHAIRIAFARMLIGNANTDPKRCSSLDGVRVQNALVLICFDYNESVDHHLRDSFGPDAVPLCITPRAPPACPTRPKGGRMASPAILIELAIHRSPALRQEVISAAPASPAVEAP
jgi:hypothetical protein